MTNKTPIVELFHKYLLGTISPAELTALLQYIEQSEAEDELTPLIQHELEGKAVDNASLRAIVDKVEAKVFADTMPKDYTVRSNRSSWFSVSGVSSRVAVAAIIVVAAGLGWLFMRHQDRKAGISAKIEADIAPGTNRATLTLADGRTVDLSTEQSGIVIGDDISYLDGSSVINPESEIPPIPPASNSRLLTLSIPKGGTYQITLPDGTKVWLNSASTLRYPSRFDDRERVVELVGEAYFDVAHIRRFANSQNRESANLPFRVVSKGQTVEVLGTKFNISAYSDEPEVKTTLVEGRVRISTGKAQTSILAPGQQLTNGNGAVHVATVDVTDYSAWKEGRFVFYGTSMASLIKQIERWYDVSFNTTVPINDIELWGTLSRDVMLSEILNVIELNTPLKFTQEGRHVMVYR